MLALGHLLGNSFQLIFPPNAFSYIYCYNNTFMKNHLHLFILLVFIFGVTSGHSQQLIEYQAVAGIDHTYQHESFMGGGAAFFDYDNDGDDDLYLTSGNRPDIFYVNNGNGTFTEKTNEAGFFPSRSYNTMGVITGDIDNDGFKDVFVTTKQKLNESFGKNLLFHNNGDGTFSEIWPEDAVEAGTWSISATFLDYNLDGLLDIYIGNYVDVANILRDESDNIIGYGHECFKNQFYENLGNGEFRERSSVLGIDNIGCALAVTASDFDEDGDMDLILANDFGPDIEPNRFFRNEIISADGSSSNRFEEIGAAINANQAIYGMGIAVGDYDNDLDLDYYITNNGNNLLLQNNNGQFIEAAAAANIDNTYNVPDSILAVGWGCSFLDLDNDADLDMYIANGFVPGPDFLPTNIEDYDKVFLNNGDATFRVDTANYFIDNHFVSRGMAHSDIDNDGDLDVISVVQKAPFNATRNSKLFQNQLIQENSAGSNWLQIGLTGTTINRDAYGSRVYLYADNQTFMRELSGGSSHSSHSTSILHFGLNTIELVDSIKIKWLGEMESQTIYSVPANRRILITQQEANFTTNTQEILKKEGIKIFPNPSQEQLYVDLSDLTNKQQLVFLKVLSITGKTVLPIENLAANFIQTINISGLSSGIYFLEIKTASDRQLVKFVKE